MSVGPNFNQINTIRNFVSSINSWIELLKGKHISYGFKWFSKKLIDLFGDILDIANYWRNNTWCRIMFLFALTKCWQQLNSWPLEIWGIMFMSLHSHSWRRADVTRCNDPLGYFLNLRTFLPFCVFSQLL